MGCHTLFVMKCPDLVGAIVAVFLLALLYEGLKTLREYLIFWDYKHWHKHTKKSPANLTQSDKSSLIVNEDRPPIQKG